MNPLKFFFPYETEKIKLIGILFFLRENNEHTPRLLDAAILINVNKADIGIAIAENLFVKRELICIDRFRSRESVRYQI